MVTTSQTSPQRTIRTHYQPVLNKKIRKSREDKFEKAKYNSYMSTNHCIAWCV